jgi:hypothetical protein
LQRLTPATAYACRAKDITFVCDFFVFCKENRKNHAAILA